LDKVDRKTLPTLDGVDVDELVADLRKKLPA
jgi:hypothetical protein